jgi:hypothetical protein
MQRDGTMLIHWSLDRTDDVVQQSEGLVHKVNAVQAAGEMETFCFLFMLSFHGLMNISCQDGAASVLNSARLRLARSTTDRRVTQIFARREQTPLAFPVPSSERCLMGKAYTPAMYGGPSL